MLDGPTVASVPPRLTAGCPSRVTDRRPARTLLAALALAFAGALGGWLPPATVSRAEAASPFELDLYRKGDFVSQSNLVQCIGASMQMMINLVEDENDRSAATQERLFLMAREWSRRRTNGPPRGASVRGWAGGLNRLGYGPYIVQPFDTAEEALRAAARSIRVTGKPIGLLVWAGRHAWVMSGFRATADPLATDGFTVTHATILDPLYPRHSTTWGRSPSPGESVSVKALANYFVPRRKTTFSGALTGKYVIVMPLPEPRGESVLRLS